MWANIVRVIVAFGFLRRCGFLSLTLLLPLTLPYVGIVG